MAAKPAQTADPAELAAELGVDVNPELFRRALTHRSYAYENGDLPHNERLEFLGDSVLGVVVTESLYRAHPDLAEGRLAKLRASVVNMRALAEVARQIGADGIGKYILLGRGEDATGGRDKPSILADTLEAIIGAVYLEHGLDVAARVVHQLFDRVLAAAPGYGAALDWKTSLQELTAVRGLGVPEYVITSDGPDHAKSFTAAAVVDGTTYGIRLGRNKKEAEQAAAEAAWRALSPEPSGVEQAEPRCDPPVAAPLAGSALADSTLPGPALAGSALADSTLPGPALADSALADSALPGPALADSALPGPALPDSALPDSARAEPRSDLPAVG